MHADFARTTPADRYKLLASTVVPRPIAWIVTRSAQGVLNLAPFSFFNVMSGTPPLVVVGIGARADGSLKDTSANILATGEFVVHLVSEELVGAMNLSAIDAPPEVDEIALAGLATVPSIGVTPPRLAEAAVAMECRLAQRIEAGASTIVLGEVLHFHIDDRFIDPVKLHVDTKALHMIGRMHGGGWYTHTHDLFRLDRPTWPQPD